LKKKNVVWTAENLDKWLARPSAFVPGTKMTFFGLQKEDQREDVIAYLKENSK
jgi:cytochrome c